ncbi:hypothetical protein NKY44_27035 [Sinorhizobium meliloti]|uniref:hypothetical protein n=1 Tax=Rhizobium meliloti TaxID=382 RepID=UPI003D64EB0A
MNMPDWFEATGDTYFKHMNGTAINSVGEAKGSEAELSVRAAAKKSEAVKIADRFVAGYRPCSVSLRRGGTEGRS